MISLIKNNTEATPRPFQSLAELGKLITQSDWSPIVYRDNYRRLANFKESQLVVLDVDSGCTLKDALVIFEPYKHIIATTRNHQKEKNGIVADRFRVVLFADKPILLAEDYKSTLVNLRATRFPFIDENAMDAARMFYPCNEVVSVRESGLTVPTTKGRVAKATMDFLNHGAKDGEWNASFFKSAKDLQQQGYSYDETVEKLNGVTGFLKPQSLRTIQSAFNSQPKHPPRQDKDAAIKAVILKSKLMVNLKDSKTTALVDFSSGEIAEVHIKAIQRILGQEFQEYVRHNAYNAYFEYMPQQASPTFADDRGVLVYNTFQPPLWKRANHYGNHDLGKIDVLPEIYASYFKHLTDNDEVSFEYLLDWMANSIRSRNFTILAAIGEPGIGKGILGEILKKLHGESNFAKVRDHVFKAQFNAPLAYKTLVYVDEIAINRKEDIDRIKDVVNKNIEIERKGEDPISVANYASFYITSNRYESLPIEPGDRRFSIIQLTEMPLNKAKDLLAGRTLQQYADLLEADENIEQLGLYLMRRQLKHNMYLPLQNTRRYEDVKEASLAEWERWVLYTWAERSENRGVEVSYRDIQKAIKDEGVMKASPGRNKIADLGRKYPQIIEVVKPHDNNWKIRVVGEAKAEARCEHCGQVKPKF